MILNAFFESFNNPYSKTRTLNLAKHLGLNLFLKLKQAGEHQQEQHTMSESLQPPGTDEYQGKQKGREAGMA